MHLSPSNEATQPRAELGKEWCLKSLPTPTTGTAPRQVWTPFITPGNSTDADLGVNRSQACRRLPSEPLASLSNPSSIPPQPGAHLEPPPPQRAAGKAENAFNILHKRESKTPSEPDEEVGQQQELLLGLQQSSCRALWKLQFLGNVTAGPSSRGPRWQ